MTILTWWIGCMLRELSVFSLELDINTPLSYISKSLPVILSFSWKFSFIQPFNLINLLPIFHEVLLQLSAIYALWFSWYLLLSVTSFKQLLFRGRRKVPYLFSIHHIFSKFHIYNNIQIFLNIQYLPKFAFIYIYWCLYREISKKDIKKRKTQPREEGLCPKINK